MVGESFAIAIYLSEMPQTLIHETLPFYEGPKISMFSIIKTAVAQDTKKFCLKSCLETCLKFSWDSLTNVQPSLYIT